MPHWGYSEHARHSRSGKAFSVSTVLFRAAACWKHARPKMKAGSWKRILLTCVGGQQVLNEGYSKQSFCSGSLIA